MTWCQSCGEQYEGSTHNCGVAHIANDELERLRKIEVAARAVLAAMDSEFYMAHEEIRDALREVLEGSRLMPSSSLEIEYEYQGFMLRRDGSDDGKPHHIFFWPSKSREHCEEVLAMQDKEIWDCWVARRPVDGWERLDA